MGNSQQTGNTKSKRTSSSDPTRADTDGVTSSQQGPTNKNGVWHNDSNVNNLPPSGDSNGGSARRTKEDLSVKVYRSYSSIPGKNAGKVQGGVSSTATTRPDIKVYRRSVTSGSSSSIDDKSFSLPRGFGRSHSAYVGMTGSEASPSSRRASTMQRQRSRNSSSSVTQSNTGYRVTKEDFPDAATTQRKLTAFESEFIRCVTAAFKTLPSDTRLSCLAVAVHIQDSNTKPRPVSLLEYLQDAKIPEDLRQGVMVNSYRLSTPTTVYLPLIQARREVQSRLSEPLQGEQWVSLTEPLLRAVLSESARELLRIYEYQIALLSEGISIAVLASHAADCVVTLAARRLQQTRGSAPWCLDVSQVLKAVTRGESKVVNPGCVSVIVGMKELKWNLSSMLRCPGLRKDAWLPQNTPNTSGSPAPSLFNHTQPWLFCTAPHCDPMLYGYRGVVLRRDVITGVYHADQHDIKTYHVEMELRQDDFHRLYCPYRRLLDADVISDYFDDARSKNATPSVSPGEYLMRRHGNAYRRDRVLPVYRPMQIGADSDYQKFNVDTVDLPPMLDSFAVYSSDGDTAPVDGIPTHSPGGQQTSTPLRSGELAPSGEHCLPNMSPIDATLYSGQDSQDRDVVQPNQPRYNQTDL